MGRKRILLADDESHEEPLVNLTPLIDVVFVVLITFMIVAPVLDLDRVALAESGPADRKERVSLDSTNPLSITVRADNTIWFQQKQVALSELGGMLAREKKRHPTAIPKVIHDSKATFGTYQAVKNTVEACGFEEMDVVLQPR